MAALNITKDNFEKEVLQSDIPVLVDFWASWCGPCKMISPVVEEISEETPNVKICKVNVDEEEELAMKYGVMSIPTLIFFKGGQEVNKVIGVVPKSDIVGMING